nr:NADH dehydrogenase subunit 3 [Nemalecium lighti]
MNKEIISLVFIIILAAIISLIISNLSYVLSKKNPYKEKTSVYECGFSPFKSTSAPFSIKFFLVAIIFLIFDLEIILLFPWSSSLLYLPKISHFTMIFFLIFITLGLIYEWYKGALEW